MLFPAIVILLPVAVFSEPVKGKEFGTDNVKRRRLAQVASRSPWAWINCFGLTERIHLVPVLRKDCHGKIGTTENHRCEVVVHSRI